MAYKASDLSVLAYANGFTLWHYKTTDSKTKVKGSGYFNDAYDVLRADDMIIHSLGDFLRVSSKADSSSSNVAIAVASILGS